MEPDVAVMNVLHRVVDAATVRTVFGEPLTRNGMTVIPVASVRSAGGGGGGTQNEGHDDSGTGGSGTGGGLALAARPVGVFVVTDDAVRWRPSVDVGRVVLGGQVVAIALLLVARALIRRRDRRASKK